MCVQPLTSTQIGLSRLIVFARVQYFIQILPIMFSFSESADMCLSFYEIILKHLKHKSSASDVRAASHFDTS